MDRSTARLLKLGFWTTYLAAFGFGAVLVARDLVRMISSPDRLAPAFSVVLGRGDDQHFEPAPVAETTLLPAPQSAAPAVTGQDAGGETKPPVQGSGGRPARTKHEQKRGRS
jgi:hypothetical protein